MSQSDERIRIGGRRPIAHSSRGCGADQDHRGDSAPLAERWTPKWRPAWGHEARVADRGVRASEVPKQFDGARILKPRGMPPALYPRLRPWGGELSCAPTMRGGVSGQGVIRTCSSVRCVRVHRFGKMKDWGSNFKVAQSAAAQADKAKFDLKDLQAVLINACFGSMRAGQGG